MKKSGRNIYDDQTSVLQNFPNENKSVTIHHRGVYVFATELY